MLFKSKVEEEDLKIITDLFYKVLKKGGKDTENYVEAIFLLLDKHKHMKPIFMKFPMFKNLITTLEKFKKD